VFIVSVRPFYFHGVDFFTIAQSDFELKAVSAKASSRRHGTVEFLVLSVLKRDVEFHFTADSGAVGGCPFEENGDPLVVISGIFEKGILKIVAGICSSHFSVNILVTVIVKISETDTVAFLKMAEPSGCGNILKIFAIMVAEHTVWYQRGIIRRAGTEIKIQESVVVQIAEIATHRAERSVKFGFFRN